MRDRRLLERWIRGFEARRADRYARTKERHDFAWGLEHLAGPDPGADADPAAVLERHTERALGEPAAYFVPAERPEFRLEGNRLVFASPVSSGDEVNDRVVADYRRGRDDRLAVLLVPHWNSSGSTYDVLARLIRFATGVSTLRLRLPHHEERAGPAARSAFPELPSGLMVSADLGRTLQAMRQAVQESIAAGRWLRDRGHRRVAVLGASIGSCAAFLAAAHAPAFDGAYLNFFSSSFGDVVWTGRSTRHVRRSLEDHVSREQLRRYWLPNSPAAFADSVRRFNPDLRAFVVAGWWDETFRWELSADALAALEEEDVRHEAVCFPCGHFSLALPPFGLFALTYIIRFLRRLSVEEEAGR